MFCFTLKVNYNFIKPIKFTINMNNRHFNTQLNDLYCCALHSVESL